MNYCRSDAGHVRRDSLSSEKTQELSCVCLLFVCMFIVCVCCLYISAGFAASVFIVYSILFLVCVCLRFSAGSAACVFIIFDLLCVVLLCTCLLFIPFYLLFVCLLCTCSFFVCVCVLFIVYSVEFLVCVVCLFQQALQHGSGVCGSGLSALDGVSEVLNSSAALPDLLILAGQNLSAALPCQTRLV